MAQFPKHELHFIHGAHRLWTARPLILSRSKHALPRNHVLISLPSRQYKPPYYLLEDSREPAAENALIPVTMTQPATTTVTASLSSLATPLTAGLITTVWMWLIAPECSAARANDSICYYPSVLALYSAAWDFRYELASWGECL